MPAKFAQPGRITAAEAAKKYGLDLHTLCDRIDEGWVPSGQATLLGQACSSRVWALRDLRERRLETGRNSRRMTKAAGFSREHWYLRVERGERRCALEAAQAIAAELGIAVENLFDLAGVPAGGRTQRSVDAADFAEFVAERRASSTVCALEGCDRPALVLSDACSGPHGLALAKKGTKLSRETCRRMSAGKRGRPRPDVSERVAEMHADPKQRYPWNLALLEGRGLRAASIAPTKIRNAKNRVNGLKGHRPRGYSDLQAKAVRELHEREGIGIKRLKKRTGLSIRQIRAILNPGNA